MIAPVRLGRRVSLRKGDVQVAGLATPASRQNVQLMMRSFRSRLRQTFVNRDIEQLVLANIKARFTVQAKQRDPETGTPWARLSPQTPRRRKVNKGTRKKLVDTGSLQDAIFIKRAKMVDATRSTLAVGVSTITVKDQASRSSPGINLVDIARTHQFGDDTVPARPFLGVSRKEGRQVERLFDVRLARSTPGFGNPMR